MISKSNEIIVIFQSDEIAQRRGFLASYQAGEWF